MLDSFFKISFLILSFWLLFSSYSFSQNDVPDTVFVKRNLEEIVIDTMYIKGGMSTNQVIVGTCFLPGTVSEINLLNHGLDPISLSVLNECNGDETFKPKPLFQSIKRKNDSLIIDVNIMANCCHNFLGSAEVNNENVLVLGYLGYGAYCSCDCCYTLRYIFDTSMEDEYVPIKHVAVKKKKEVGTIPLPIPNNNKK
jgi:hypothetical protein